MAEAEEKQYSILMTDDLAQKTYDDLKRQTRRPLRKQPAVGATLLFFDGVGCRFSDDTEVKFPYGKVGGRIYVKENFTAYGEWESDGTTSTGQEKWRFKYLKKEVVYSGQQVEGAVFGQGQKNMIGWFRRPSLFMPQWAARSIVEIVEIRPQRVQDISESDAEAEGINLIDFNCYENYLVSEDWIYEGTNQREMHALEDPVMSFASLWEKINKARGFGWDANPWVFAITYKKVRT